jgi:hypothetical protein
MWGRPFLLWQLRAFPGRRVPPFPNRQRLRFVVRASALQNALKRVLRTSQKVLPLEGGGLEAGVRRNRIPHHAQDTT